MSDNISKISEDFKDYAELKIQNTAQFKVIANLNKQNEELKEKIRHLETLLQKTTPVVVQANSSNDPEIDICKLEILKLHEKSMQEQLTFEDAKKLETYTKIINNSRNLPKTIEIKAKKLSNDDLLMTLEEGQTPNE